MMDILEGPERIERLQELRVGVVLPSYNEAGHLPDVLATMPAWVWRIYVVDDCSTDNTAEVIAPLVDERVRYLCHEVNQGVGGGMKTGYRAGMDDGARILVKMDADGQMSPDDMLRLIAPIALGLAEYSKGDRFRVRKERGAMPEGRKFGNIIASLGTKIGSGYWHVFDPQCGYTAISSAALEMIDLDAIASDYFFENDMLVALSSAGARTVDVPIETIYGDEISHIRMRKVIFSFPARMIQRWSRRVIRRHFLWDFDAIGLLAVSSLVFGTFGVVFGGYHWWLSNTTGVPATTGTVMIAVLPIIMAFQLGLTAMMIEVGNSPGSQETREYYRILMSGTDLAGLITQGRRRSDF